MIHLPAKENMHMEKDSLVKIIKKRLALEGEELKTIIENPK